MITTTEQKFITELIVRRMYAGTAKAYDEADKQLRALHAIILQRATLSSVLNELLNPEDEQTMLDHIGNPDEKEMDNPRNDNSQRNFYSHEGQ